MTGNFRGDTPIRLPFDRLRRSAWALAVAALAVTALLMVRAASVAVAAPAVAAASSSPSRGDAQGVRTMAQDGRGATFEVVPRAAGFDTVPVDGTSYTRVTLPGASITEAPGRPALPTLSLHVAIPEGMSPRLRVVSEDWETRAGSPPIPVVRQRFVADDPKTGPVSEFRTEPDASVYRGSGVYPAEPATMGNGALVGEWWIAPVHVRPVRWDPRDASFRVLRKMTIRVDFVPATERELSVRPSTRPGAQARTWDRVQRGLVKNYEAARSFPARPRAGVSGASSGTRTRMAVNPEWKLSIAQTGWVSVAYATLAASGFPSGIAIDNVRIEERGYDDTGDSATATPIPVVARDNNTNELFDAGDVVTFYARSIRDRYGAGHIELRYSDVNVYWLTWGSTPAAVPDTVSGNIPGTATTPTSFQDVIRLEQDNFVAMSPNQFLTTPPEAIEYLFWTDGFDPDQFETAIPFVDPDPAQPFRIRSRYQGRMGSIHRLDIFFQSSSGVTDTLALDTEFFDRDVYLLDTGFTIPGTHIGSGTNRYRHLGERRLNFGAPLQPGSAALLDVVEITYNRFYIARNNLLRFTSGSTLGLIELRVGGFSSSAIEVYDVTNPLVPIQVTDIVVNPSGGSFEVVFRTDAAGGQRRFMAFVPGAESPLGAASVLSDGPSDLRTPGSFGPSNNARAIFVTTELLRAQTDRLAGYRRTQGYVVEVADIQDVYDEFNGGVKSARALRRYLRHAYLSWTPRPMFVILAGDGSLDYRHHIPSSSADLIPTYLRFETISGPQGEELVAHDSYYALNLSLPEHSEVDFVPSVSLTRITASSSAELGLVVDKIIAYESFASSDTWRGRQLLFSDDEYSQGLLFNQGYCFQPQEAEFKVASQAMADITAQSVGGVDIRSDFFDLKTYTDAVPPSSGSCKILSTVKSALVVNGGGYGALLAQINQGGLIFNVESHANRYLVAHEDVLCTGVNCGSPNTPDRIQNVNRPFYLMVWGCHSNQFPDGPQGGNVDSSDAMGEIWLQLPDRGSVGSFGSTGYEFLNTNAAYNTMVADAFYTTPPAPAPPPGEPPQARWILGEVMLQAAVRNGMSQSFIQQVMNRTMHLLADPMLRMDALPPRVFEATVAGAPFSDNALLTSDSPTDSLTLIAQLRDEVAIDSVYLAERDLTSGGITPLDSTLYSVSFSDSSRLATVTANVRPRVGNYDLQIRATDINARLRVFTLQIRTPIRYLANGVEILDNVFVQSGATLRAEVTSPIPLTADSLELVIDGVVVPSTKTQLDAAGRSWALEASSGSLGAGSHTIQVAIGGRTTGFDQRIFQITTDFTIRGVAVVDPRMKGVGCGGSVFQYELSAAARNVELVIFTVAGRRIASIPMPGQAGFNVFCWDGRDSQAHDAAQGVYLYRLRATDTNGKIVSKDGRLIRAR
jgi:hypothetical protein